MSRNKFEAVEFKTTSEAIQDARNRQRVAISMDGKALVISEIDADCLSEAGVKFGYLTSCLMSDGSRRILTVPIN